MTPTSTPRPQISPSEAETGKAYLLGQLDERKAVSRYLAVRAARALANGATLPWWAFIRRKKAMWSGFGAALAAKDIEEAEHVTDQAVWVIDLKDGIIIGREAFRCDSDQSPKGEDAVAASSRSDASAGPEDIAHG